MRLSLLISTLLTLSILVPSSTHAEVNEIIFAARQPGVGGHWYENFGYYIQDPATKLYRAKGQLCRLDLRTNHLTVILDDPKGSIRDPQLHYDAKKILFSYRRAGSEHFHLYEINIDGTGLKQLTDGPFDDLEPTYLSDGHIMFCSSRCNQWVPCWYSQVAVLYTCDADGKNITRISANIEHDNTPWMLPDGRVIYERWEYVDRSRVGFHHLWTMNPDGTAQMIYYGNMHPNTLMIDPKPIPGSDQIVAVFSPGHGKKEHEGVITLVTPNAGPDDQSSAKPISRTDDCRDPYPLSESSFLVARGSSILLMNAQGETKELYRLPADLAKAGVECHEPCPLIARQREPILPRRTSPTQATGKLILSDIYLGRRMEGVRRGEIKKLLVLETLPKPINDSGKMPPISFLGTFTLERILGTVPVEPDGSAYLEVPPLRTLFVVALDENNNSVKRMMSFMTVQPGETMSCVGCHERRTETPRFPSGPSPMALRRPASKIEPLPHIPDVFDFPRDIQPILDKHCVSCHDYDRQSPQHVIPRYSEESGRKDESARSFGVPQDDTMRNPSTMERATGPRAGNVILTGDHGPIFSHSYYTLVALCYISDGRDRLVTNLPPRSIGTSASRLMKLIDGSHYNAKLSPHEQDMIRYWIESGAPYPGTYASIGTGQIGGYPKSVLDTSDQKWPESIAAADAIRRRCTTCHDKAKPMPRFLSDDLGLVLSNPDDNDPRIRWSRHLMFNLSRPDKSLILLAPLAQVAGGFQRCGQPVFASPADPDYQAILALCREGQRHLNTIKRFDMPNFRPLPWYTREMQRYGILPPTLALNTLIDVYATDQAFWRSKWWQPLPTD